MGTKRSDKPRRVGFVEPEPFLPFAVAVVVIQRPSSPPVFADAIPAIPIIGGNDPAFQVHVIVQDMDQFEVRKSPPDQIRF
jgi:hypothetical protein